MSIGNDIKMRELDKIQSLLNPQKSLSTNFAFGCDCTGCSNACYESCGDGLGPMS